MRGIFSSDVPRSVILLKALPTEDIRPDVFQDSRCELLNSGDAHTDSILFERLRVEVQDKHTGERTVSKSVLLLSIYTGALYSSILIGNFVVLTGIR